MQLPRFATPSPIMPIRESAPPCTTLTEGDKTEVPALPLWLRVAITPPAAPRAAAIFPAEPKAQGFPPATLPNRRVPLIIASAAYVVQAGRTLSRQSQGHEVLITRRSYGLFRRSPVRYVRSTTPSGSSIRRKPDHAAAIQDQRRIASCQNGIRFTVGAHIHPDNGGTQRLSSSSRPPRVQLVVWQG